MRHLGLPAALLLTLPLGLAPAIADACGGTFCDGAGPPMPVDQTGEDILFIQDGDEIEVHVRIQYTGEAERFAWMVPLAGIPDVSVGSEELFLQIARASIPFWTTTRSFQDPNDNPSNGSSLGFTPDNSDSGDDDPDGPKVVLEDSVGSFDIVVLQGGSAAEVIEFFIDNDYAFNDDAEPLIQEYIDEGFLITGVRLSAGAEVEAIHPLVFRFIGDEPCVPIRLTAVAAADDMGIRAYFLGQERWAPTNYKHVVLNPMAYDWNGNDFATYVELLSLAVDEAGGQAWATEYAGPSDAVATQTIWQEGWTSSGMELMSAYEVLATLEAYGMLPFNTGPGSQLRGLLREHIPPPEDWPDTEDAFWVFYYDHPDLIAPVDWDPATFAADFDERLLEPSMHAADLLEAWPYLTRLHTTMSAPEMTLDPTFHPAPDLYRVGEVRTANSLVFNDFLKTEYDVPLTITGLDATVVSRATLCVHNDGPWPWSSGSIAEMPRALRIEEVPMSGPPQVLTDNEPAIREALEDHNSTCGIEEPPPGGESGESGEGESGEGESGGMAPGASEDGASSCACSTTPEEDAPLGLAFGLLGLAGLGLVRRR